MKIVIAVFFLFNIFAISSEDKKLLKEILPENNIDRLIKKSKELSNPTNKSLFAEGSYENDDFFDVRLVRVVRELFSLNQEHYENIIIKKPQKNDYLKTLRLLKDAQRFIGQIEKHKKFKNYENHSLNFVHNFIMEYHLPLDKFLKRGEKIILKLNKDKFDLKYYIKFQHILYDLRAGIYDKGLLYRYHPTFCTDPAYGLNGHMWHQDMTKEKKYKNPFGLTGSNCRYMNDEPKRKR